MTPNLAIIRFEKRDWFWGLPIVVPVFLLWIPAIVVGPFVLLILWACCVATRVSFTATVGTAWRLLCALPGTDVRVTTDGNQISVRIV